MRQRRFVVAFQSLAEIHLTKDVGGIPAALSKYWEIDHHFIGGRSTPKGKKYTSAIFCHSSSRIIQKLGFLYTLIRTVRAGDIANIYHLSPFSTMAIMALRLIHGDRIKIYVKLDMNTQEKSLRIAGIIAGTVNASSAREILIKAVGHWICRNVDIISAESSTVFSITSQWPAKAMLKIPNGFFEEEYLQANESITARRVNRFISVARHGTEPKRSEELLEAFSIAELPADWTLSLVGDYTREFEQLLADTIRKKPHLRERITLHGPIHDRVELITMLSRSKIFAAASSYEGFSLALLEAAACGCYCISTNTGGASDVIGQNGIILDYDADAVAIAAALSRAVSSSMEFNHLRFANDTARRYSWKTILEPLVDWLQISKNQRQLAHPS